VELVAAHHVDDLRGVADRDDTIPVVGEEVLEILADVFVVVDDEEAQLGQDASVVQMSERKT
jgi:hypothetical protein